MVQTLYGVHDKTGNPPSHGHARAYLSVWPQIDTYARKPRLRGRRPLADVARGDRCVPGRAWGHDHPADLYRRGEVRGTRRPAPPLARQRDVLGKVGTESVDIRGRGCFKKKQ